MAKGGRKSKAASVASKQSKKGVANDETPSKVSAVSPKSGEEGTWKLVCVIPKQNRADMACFQDDCKEEPVSTWINDLEPESPCHTCEKCRVEHCGLWPEGVDRPSASEDSSDDDFPQPVNEPEPESEPSECLSSTQSEAVPTSDVDANANVDMDIEEAAATETLEATDNKDSDSTTAEDNKDEDSDTKVGDETPEIKPKIEIEVTSNDNDVDAESESLEGEDEDDEDDEEAWDLIEIFSLDVLTNCPIPCDGGEDAACSLKACVSYQGNKSKTLWRGCLDCQDREYGGWPETEAEIPTSIKELSQELKDAMAVHCSADGQPDFAEVDKLLAPRKCSGTTMKTSNPAQTGSLTPVPSATTHKITPVPAFAAGLEKKKKKNQEVAKAATSKKNQGQIQKWQLEADKMNGPGVVKIVVEKKEVKKLVFDFLFDQMGPMTVSDTYKAFNGKIPGSVLSSCINDMAALNESFEMSDEDDDEPKATKKKIKKEPEDRFVGSIRCKAGKGPANTLYYVDHNKTKNNGNPDTVEANELVGNLCTAEAEASLLDQKVKAMNSEAGQLEAEPTNVELVEALSNLEPAIEALRAEVEDKQGLKVNAKRRKVLETAILKMTAETRKRRRIAEDFVINMADHEASFGSKKIWKGDGPVYLEGDDMIIEQAKEAASAKPKKNPLLGRSKLAKKAAPKDLSDPKFIAVKITSGGSVERIYAE